jgi:hypothetical protein
VTSDLGNQYIAVMSQLSMAKKSEDLTGGRLRRQHASQVAASEQALSRANDEIAAATAWLADAQAFANQADQDAEVIWYGLMTKVLHRRAGPRCAMPAPALRAVESGSAPEKVTKAGSRPPAANTVARCLSEAQDLLDQLKAGNPPTAANYLALVSLGFAGSLAAYLLSRGLVLAGDQFTSTLGVLGSALGKIVALMSPLAGLLGLPWYQGRNVLRFSPALVVTICIAGLLATIGSLALIRPVLGL